MSAHTRNLTLIALCHFYRTECSSESDVCEVMTGLKLDGDKGLSFFLMARICSRALNAKIKTNKLIIKLLCRQSNSQSHFSNSSSSHVGRELTQSADGAAVGLVAQRVCAGVAETQVPARQDESVSHIGQTHHTLGTVVTDLIVGDLWTNAQDISVIQSTYKDRQ